MSLPSPNLKQSQPVESGSFVAGSTTPKVSLGRLAIMGLIVSALLLAVNGFVCATCGYFFGIQGWLIWQVIPGSLPLAFVLTTVLGFRYSNPLLRAVYTLSAIWVGGLNFAFAAAGACWIADIPDWLARSFSLTVSCGWVSNFVMV